MSSLFAYVLAVQLNALYGVCLIISLAVPSTANQKQNYVEASGINESHFLVKSERSCKWLNCYNIIFVIY